MYRATLFFYQTTGYSRLLPARVGENRDDTIIFRGAEIRLMKGTGRPGDFRCNSLVTWVIHILSVNGMDSEEPAPWPRADKQTCSVSAVSTAGPGPPGPAASAERPWDSPHRLREKLCSH